MITAIAQFRLSEPLSLEKAQSAFLNTAPNYRDIPGLLRKYYLLSEDGETAGGVYLWRSREDAEKLYTEEWKNFIKDKYGSDPQVTYFASPVVVDNLIGEIIEDV